MLNYIKHVSVNCDIFFADSLLFFKLHNVKSIVFTRKSVLILYLIFTCFSNSLIHIWVNKLICNWKQFHGLTWTTNLSLSCFVNVQQTKKTEIIKSLHELKNILTDKSTTHLSSILHVNIDIAATCLIGKLN